MASSDVNGLRLRLVELVLRLPEGRLDEVERFLMALPDSSPAPGAAPAQRDWPHAPLHRLSEQGTHIVTAGTCRKEHHFCAADRLDHLEAALLALANEAGWQLEAWAVFSNHYHFVGHAGAGSERKRTSQGRGRGVSALLSPGPPPVGYSPPLS